MNSARQTTQIAKSKTVRWVLMGVGAVSLGIGAVGVVLPLLPTTPFLLLAAACFARSSVRFHNWLINHPFWGEIIVEWRTHRRLPKRAKRTALISIPLTFGFSTYMLISTPIIWIPLDIFAVGLFLWLMRLPTPEQLHEESR